MFTPVPAPRDNDLPLREKSFWRMTGPGAVMIGLSIGSGELVLWPWITAKFGVEMLWAAAFGLFIQVWVNIEIGRWVISTGESVFTGFARIARWTVFYFFVPLLAIAILPGWARAAGTCIKLLFFGPDGPGADWMWTAGAFACALAIMFGPKNVYRAVELSVTLMVILITGGMLVVALTVGTFSDALNFIAGFANVGHLRFTDDFTLSKLFGAVVFAGAGGFGNLFYAYYLREKGIGMGARMPTMTSALRSKDAGGAEAGFRFRDTPENIRRFADWFRYVILDNTFYFFLLNALTMFLFMFGSFVVLFANGNVPAESTIIWDLAMILGDSLGPWGRYLYLLIAVAAMFSTQLTFSDGTARLWTDLFHLNFKFAKRWPANRMYLAFALGLSAISVFSTWVLETHDVSALDFFFLNAVANGFAMALYVPLLVYLNYKCLPKAAHPKPLYTFMMIVASATYISFAVYIIVDKAVALAG